MDWNNIVACPCFGSREKRIRHSAGRWVVDYSCDPRDYPPLPQTGKERINGRAEKEKEKEGQEKKT